MYLITYSRSPYERIRLDRVSFSIRLALGLCKAGQMLVTGIATSNFSAPRNISSFP